MTNTFEGRNFVNLSTAAEVTATKYAATLFPDLTTEQSEKAGELYAGFGAPIDQVVAIQGEGGEVYCSDRCFR
jgi:hypothetical protein